MFFRRFYSNIRLSCWNQQHQEDDEIVELVDRVSGHDLSERLPGPSFVAIDPTAVTAVVPRFKLTYNIQLPSEHRYLGKLERRVDPSETTLLEPNSIHRILVTGHHSIVYPGEIVPLMLTTNSLLDFEGRTESSHLGLVFWELPHRKKIYGVVCRVREKVIRDAVYVLKTTAQQRFQLIPQPNGALTRSVEHGGVPHYYADVRILPEVLLQDPLATFCAANNLKSRSLAAQSTVWPRFVYDQYGSSEVPYKVRRYLEFLQIKSVPSASDPVLLSFWLARNIPLTERDRKEMFFTDSVLARMLLVSNILDYSCAFCCKKCDRRIAHYAEMFAMSRQGVAGSYCNPSGFVHETLTVYRAVPKATRTTSKPSAEFSWFPGYSWQIAVCGSCASHVGWKFVATKRGGSYKPRKFYGLCGNSIRVVADERRVDEDGEED